MPDSKHMRMDRWRMVILTSKSSELLVLENQHQFALPEVLVPRDQRLAWHLNKQVKRLWQLSILSIVPINTTPTAEETDSTQYHIAELVPSESPLPSGMCCVDASSLKPDAFRDSGDFDALSAFLNPSFRSELEDGPFARAGWFTEVSAWVQSVAKSRGLEWNTRFEQFHAAPSFSLIRFDTSPRALWFKAVGDPNTREFHITRVLAHRFPDYVPRLVAVRPECNGWLAEECAGDILADVFELDLWRKAARALAQLQIESVPHVNELLQTGAHPLSLLLSDSASKRFLRVGAQLFPADSKREPFDPSPEELVEVDLRVRELVTHAQSIGVPDTLGHLDLNAGNIVVSPEHCAYLDWAEAYVGLPFLSFEYLLQAFRRNFGRGSPNEALVVETYVTAWERVLSRDMVREAWALTPVLALYAYTIRCMAASEHCLNDAPHLANYVRSLIRKLKNEAGNCRARRVEVRG